MSDIQLTSAPITLDQWRRFMAYEPVIVDALSPGQVERLTHEEAERYLERRAAAINSHDVLLTPDLDRLERQFRVHRLGAHGPQFGPRQSMAVSGAQRLGKSTAALHLGKLHEITERKKTGRAGTDFAPTLYLSTPPGATPKTLMSAFAAALNLPVHVRDTTETITAQVVDVLASLSTSLIIVDEVQNLRTRAQSGLDAASALKAFMDRVPALFLFVGVDLPDSDLFAGPMSAQMQGRVTMHYLKPMSRGTQEDRDEWDSLIDLLEESLPLMSQPAGHLSSQASEFLHAATGGSIGSLRTLVRMAALGALIDGKETIGLREVKTAHRDYRAELAAREEHLTQTRQHRPGRPDARSSA